MAAQCKPLNPDSQGCMVKLNEKRGIPALSLELALYGRALSAQTLYALAARCLREKPELG